MPLPAAVVLLLVSGALAAGFAVAALSSSHLTSTTTGQIVDGDTRRTGGRTYGTEVCVGTLVFTVDGVTRSGKRPGPGPCPADGSRPTVTVHYDPDDPASFDTRGSQAIVLWAFAALAGVGTAWSVRAVARRRR